MNKRFFLFAMMAVLLVSCSDYNTLTVKKTNFGDEVLRAQNLVFTFNKELAPDTGLMSKWDSTAFIRFDPPIPGRFMWTGKSELTFSPSAPLLPASDFKASLSAELMRYSAVKFPLSDKGISFHTPYLRIESVNAYWALGESAANPVEVHCQVVFNNPVSPAQLRPLLKVSVSGKDTPYSLISQSDGESVEVAIPYDEKSQGNAGGVITIGKGITCPGGNRAGTEELKAEFQIPSKEKLTITGMETGFQEGKGYVDVFTSLPVMSEGLNRFVATDPALSVETETLPNGFRIKGEFLGSSSYQIILKKGLLSVFGKELEEDLTETVSFADPAPGISFTEHKAMYLSTRGERNLGVHIINVPRVRVSVFKIFENNIQHYMRSGRQWDYTYDEETELYSDSYTWQFDENYGKPVFSREVMTRSLQKSGNISLLNLDPSEFNAGETFKGLYLVKVEATDRKFIQDVQLLSLSDLGLIVKQGSTDVFVFVNSLKDATPVKGARVDFISSNNQKLYSAVSDNQGVAVFRNARQMAAGFRMSMVTAKYENDFNFVLFDRSGVETSRFDAGGKRTDNGNYDVFIYGDRDLYRPGDTAHVNTIVRTLRWGVVKDIPVKIRLLAPNGREFQSRRQQLNASGAAETSFCIPRQSMTGSYLIEVSSANDVLLASRKIAVEEFVPDRIKVSSATAKNVYFPAENIQLDLLAENLYGTPAAGRRFETELRLKRKQLTSKAFTDYTFAIESKNMPVLASSVSQGSTGADGKAAVNLQTNAYRDIGLLEGRIFTTVFDETGRPVNRLNVIEVPTQQVYFGIRNSESWISTRKAVNLQFAAIDRTGKAMPGAKARIVILGIRYETVIEHGSGGYNYVSQRKERVVWSGEKLIPAAGLSMPFTPLESCEYEVRIMTPESENYVSRTFYAYGWGDTDYSSFEVNREGEVTITPDRTSYKPGDRARLLFKAPFDGQLLVSFEQDNVLSYKMITLVNKSASLDLNITADHLPNVYVDATAFRKSVDMSIPLTVAHGVISLKVEDPATRLNVSITAPEKSRSGIRQTFGVKTAPNAEVTISVVDEGILQITDYQSPDPHAWFYQKRALGVASFDVYALLFPELKRSSSPAGGEAFDLSRRINPLTGDRVKLISEWSGIRKANASGECSFSIDIPQFSGSLRVMAVAYRGNQFGSSSKSMKVADPVIVSMALPRFLSPGDQCSVAVSMTNSTETAGAASVQLSCSGPLTLIGKSNASVQLTAGGEKVETFAVNAGKGIGIGEVTATVTAFGQKFVQKIEIPVRPSGGLTFITGSGSLLAGASKTFRVSTDLYPAGVKSALILSKSPALEVARHLGYLIRYPYGCLEQTVSTAFPQLYLEDLVKLYPSSRGRNTSVSGTPGYHVQQAIRKVESMQLYNGGLSLWPQGGSADWWATAYAAHFLLEAGKAGYEVNPAVLGNAMKFLSQKVKERETETFFYFENGQQKSRTIARREIIYSVYLLALADQAPVSVMNYYKSSPAMLAPESRYLLASAYMLAGDQKSYRSLLPKSFGTEESVNMFGGCYASYLRDRSLALNALLEADPYHPQVTELVKGIAKEMTARNYISTQEAGFALLALGKHARRAAASEVKAKIAIDGKEAGTYDGKDLQLPADLNNHTVSISTQGKGAVYYYWEVSGIKISPNTGDEDKHLSVRRRFLDRNGNVISGNTFRQNDLVVVEITLRAESGSEVANVAVTDLLPACFEIENSRLVAEREMDFMKNRSTPEYTDIRDDRISFFTSAGGNTKTFYYTVRAVSRGSYILGAVSADAMYNGEYHSYSGSGTVIVK
jgi:alpha-2-macroglobulin